MLTKEIKESANEWKDTLLVVWKTYYCKNLSLPLSVSLSLASDSACLSCSREAPSQSQGRAPGD